MDVIIRWRDNKTTVEDAANLPYIRKSAGGAFPGFVYFNPHKTQYERPVSIDFIPEELKQRIITRSAAVVASKRSDNNNNNDRRATKKLPANVKLHRHFGSND